MHNQFCHLNFFIICKRTCGKEMFSQMSVCSQEVCLRAMPWDRQTLNPRAETHHQKPDSSPGHGQQASGTRNVYFLILGFLVEGIWNFPGHETHQGNHDS